MQSTFDELIKEAVDDDFETLRELPVQTRVALVTAYFRAHPYDLVETIDNIEELLAVFETLDNCKLGLVLCGKMCAYVQEPIEKALQQAWRDRSEQQDNAKQDAWWDRYAEN